VRSDVRGVNRVRIKKLGLQERMANSVVAQKLHRSYKIKLYPNRDKFDTVRYTIKRFNDYSNMFLGRIFFGQNKISTRGMSALANEALYKSKNIVRVMREAHKATGAKMNVPFVKNIACYAKIEKSKNSSFDYWIVVSNQWTKAEVVRLPAKSHRAFNKALNQGWKFSSLCECKIINENLYAIVFVSRDAPKIKKYRKTIGCDVGIKHSVVTSDGHFGYGLSKAIKVQRNRLAERQRQGHKASKNMKSCIKQILDIEAKALIRRSMRAKAKLAVESPKRLANLRSGNLQGWARSYLANRLTILGKESGVTVLYVNPYQTSITCPKCGTVDKQSRVDRDTFSCVSCKYTGHADYVAARNIAQKGTQFRMRKFSGKMSNPISQ